MPRGKAPKSCSTGKRHALRTLFVDHATPVPSSNLYLGFMSLAVDDAVRTASSRRTGFGKSGQTSAVAAAAQAAHDVLVDYFPASRATLDTNLVDSLAVVPSGRGQAAGIRIGQRAAAQLIASRVGDGRNDASVQYSRTPAPGIWQPPPVGAPPGRMVVP